MNKLIALIFFSLVFIASIILTTLHHDPSARSKQNYRATPSFYTSSVPGTADDCAIWVHPEDPLKSAIIGNDKRASGALFVWDLSGNLIYKTPPIRRPTNVDVRQAVPWKGQVTDIVACGIRATNEIMVYRMDPKTRELINITAPEGISTHHTSDSYGFCLYLRPSDKALFAFVSHKGKSNIHQIRLEENEDGLYTGKLVRSFGASRIRSYVEGMVVDDHPGYLYCADEKEGVLKFLADPAMKDDSLLYKFAVQDGISGNREGMAIYKRGQGTGYLLLSSQHDHTIKVYRRDGYNEYITTIRKFGSSKTDGIAAISSPLGPAYPKGLLICHNEQKNNFAVYNWVDIEQNIPNDW